MDMQRRIKITSKIQYRFVPLAAQAIEALPVIGKDAFVAYCVLLRFLNTDGDSWPTLHQVQHYTRQGRNKLIASINILCRVNMVHKSQMRRGREFGANCYTLTDPSEWCIVDGSEV